MVGIYDAIQERRNRCDRCGLPFSDGFRWPALGKAVVLCRDCTGDLEDYARSYGEESGQARSRFLDRLREIGANCD